MNEERKEQALKIIKKYLDDKYFIDEKNANIFMLFDIDLTADIETLSNTCKNIRQIFHQDLAFEIPLQYRYAYEMIATTLVPFLPTKKTYETKDALVALERKINAYQQSLKNKTFFERDAYIQEQTKKYQEQEATYIKNNMEPSEPSQESNIPNDFKIYEPLIKGLILEYRQIKNSKIPFDAYTLFKVNRDQNAADLQNNSFINHLRQAFLPEYKAYFTNTEDAQDFMDLCIIVNNFINEINKSKSKPQGYVYTYQQEYPKSFFSSTIEKNYLNALEKSLIRNGATKTIEIFTAYFADNKNILQNPILQTIAAYKPTDVKLALARNYDVKKNNQALVENTLNALITTKLEYLKINLQVTKKHKDLEYLKKALMYYCVTGNGQLFIATTNDLGKENIINNIHPDLIKRLIGAQNEELQILLDDTKNEYMIYKNDQVVSEFVERMFNTEPSFYQKGL